MQGIMPNLNFGGMPHDEVAAQHRLLREALHAGTEELAFGDTRRTKGTRTHRGVVRRVWLRG